MERTEIVLVVLVKMLEELQASVEDMVVAVLEIMVELVVQHELVVIVG